MSKQKVQTNPICPRCKDNHMARNGRRRNSAGELVQNWVCRNQQEGRRVVCYATLDPSAPYRGPDMKPKRAEDNKPRKKFKRRIDHRRIVFTAAQNATATHLGFWTALKALAKDVDADIAVIPLRYKNPTSVFTDSQKNAEYWLRDVARQELIDENGDQYYAFEEVDERARKYLYEQRKKFNDNLVVVGDIKLQPTQVDPLTGMEGITHGESGIFGHTKLRMRCVATPQSRMPKILTTTGACTVPNYTDSKAGKKGEFHHVLGAVMVEIESRKKFHLHHINARSDGAFIYRRKAYMPDGTVQPAGRDKAIIFGDAHYRFADPAVVEATFGKGGLVETHDPEVLVWHDLLDCYFGNPHHKDNPFIRKAKFDAGFHIAEDEVRETVAWLQKLGAGRQNVIVASNHDDMFARWVIREDWKRLDAENIEFYLETALQMARSAKMSEIGAEYLDPFGYWVNRIVGNDPSIRVLKKNEPYNIAGIVLDNHGDKGPNGTRGTIKNLSQIGAKIITGHGHSPAIQDGHTRVGTMTRLEAEYTSGPGSWFNAHASIDAFDKRHLHFCVDGKFWMT